MNLFELQLKLIELSNSLIVSCEMLEKLIELKYKK